MAYSVFSEFLKVPFSAFLALLVEQTFEEKPGNMKLPKDDAFPQLGGQSTDKLFNFILMICEQAMCAPHFK